MPLSQCWPPRTNFCGDAPDWRYKTRHGNEQACSWSCLKTYREEGQVLFILVLLVHMPSSRCVAMRGKQSKRTSRGRWQLILTEEQWLFNSAIFHDQIRKMRLSPTQYIRFNFKVTSHSWAQLQMMTYEHFCHFHGMVIFMHSRAPSEITLEDRQTSPILDTHSLPRKKTWEQPCPSDSHSSRLVTNTGPETKLQRLLSDATLSFH